MRPIPAADLTVIAGLIAIVLGPAWTAMAQAAAADAEPLLVVIGDVSERSARILFDALDRALVGTVIEARLIDDVDGGAVLQHATLQVGIGPRVWHLSSLSSGKAYRVEMQARTGATSSGRFRTWSYEDGSIGLLASSCNNFLHDADDSFLSELLGNNQVRNRLGMIHLGDQLYADFIYDDWVRNGRRASHDELVNEYRDAYRKIWSRSSMRSLLRTGANWMLIDDHDIVNNLDPDQLRDGREPILRAGRRAFLEYQLQLQFDVFDENDEEVGDPRCFHTKVIGSLALVFMDTRLERSFNFEPGAPFLGARQMEFLSKTLAELDQRADISKIALVSSVPLMWAPATWVARLPEIAEKEKMALHPVHRQETLSVLDLASQYINKLFLLSGDIHLFLHSQVCRGSIRDQFCFEQITASGLTVASTAANSLKLLAFHFAALILGSNRIGDWTLIAKSFNLGHNAVLIELADNDFGWTPLFLKHPSFWFRCNQFVFTQAYFISLYYIQTCICLLSLIAISRFLHRRSKFKAKND